MRKLNNVAKNIKNKYQVITNCLKISDDDLIEKLSGNNIHITKLTVPKTTKGKFDFQQLNIDIKNKISVKNGQKAKDIKKYTYFIDKGKAIVFYFDKEEECSDFELDEIICQTKNKDTVINKLIQLQFIDYVITKTGVKHNRDLYNGDLFFAVKQDKQDKKNRVYIECLKPIFTYNHDELFIDLKLEKYRLKEVKNITVINDIENGNPMILNVDNKTFHIDPNDSDCGKVDARKSDIKYIEFKKDYSKYKNFYENLVMSFLRKMFRRYKVNFKELKISPDYTFDILFKEQEFIEEITVIDNYEYDEKELPLKQTLYQVLSDYFNDYHLNRNPKIKIEDYKREAKQIKLTFVDSKDITDFSKLSKDKSYLVLNKAKPIPKSKDTTSFYSSEEMKFNTIFDCQRAREENPSITFDFYTELKLFNLTNATNLVIQGVDIDNIKEGEKKYKENGKEYTLPALKVKGLHDFFLEYKAKDKRPKINKIIQELTLKKKLFRNEGFEVEYQDTEFNVLYVRNQKRGRGKNSTTYNKFSLCKCIIKDNLLQIKEHRVYNDISSIKGDYNILNNVYSNSETFINDSTFIFNEDFILSYYKGNKTPQIISGVKNLYDLYIKNKGDFEVSKSNRLDFIHLPLYVNCKDTQSKLLLFKTNHSLNYSNLIFNTDAYGVNSSVDKRRVVYDVYIRDKHGNYIEDIKENEMFDLFINTLTFNEIKLNNTSKTPLLKKIAKELLKE